MAMNVVILNGVLGKDPELKVTPSGAKVLRFTLAVKSNRKDENGEYKTNWVSMLAFNKTAELISDYCTKGSKIGVRGSLECGSYQKDNVTHYTTDVIVQEIEFLTSKKDAQPQQPQQQYQQPNFAPQQQYQQPNFAPPQQQYQQPVQQQQPQPQPQYKQVINETDLPF